ncbi:MAG: alpha-amylase family glycosyl hydrolase [Bacteroidales bacterium]|jgi:glycosidase
MNKKLLTVIIIYLIAISLQAQMVYTDPAIPVMGKEIKVYFNTSLVTSDAAFKNYTGNVYAHTGVTVNGQAWQNVIGTWGVNSTQPELTQVGQYLYFLDIKPDIKTYYGLSATDSVTQIDLVFRSSDTSKQTRPDIFLTVYKLNLQTTFVTPQTRSVIVSLNGQIPVNAAATMADSISLYMNNKFLKRGSTPGQVTDTITASQYGGFWVKSIAWSYPSFVADSFYLYVRPPVVMQDLPSGLVDGINYLSDTSVALVLLAPYKQNVFAIGDFNNWLPCDKGFMKETTDGNRYWVQINGLTPNKEYRFEYIVDSSLYIADPYTDKILDPVNDPYISSTTYPNLTKYPADTASGIVSTLQTAQVPYAWRTTNFQPPAKSNLVIYELLIRDFVANHDFRTIADTLSYLKNLGINAIEFMPVCEFEGNISWGYNPDFYFAPDKYYGPKNDFKALIDSCHARGIAVIMDIVLNHCMEQSPFVELYLDYVGSDQIHMKLPNPWFNAISPNPVYYWGADFNHASIYTQQLVDRITSYWLTVYNVDGFRFDFSKGFTNTPGDGFAYDASRIAILERMANHIWSVKPNAYVILEHFTADAEEQVLADYGMLLWNNFNSQYSQAAMGNSSDLTGASWLGLGWSVPGPITYMESHDEERLMYQTLTNGASTATYNTRDLKTALKRMQLDAIFFLTIPGPRMIWQFGELGYDISIDSGGRTSPKPIKWDYFSNPDRHDLYQFYRLLNTLRNTQEVFSTDNYSWDLSTPMKRLTLNGSTMCINILGNFGITGNSIDPAFPNTGKWYEYFSGDSLTVTNSDSPINLDPGEYRMYSTVKLPSQNQILSVKDVPAETAYFVSAYPNPSAGPFNFQIHSTAPVQGTLTIYDLEGRAVRQINIGLLPDSVQNIVWDGKTESGAEASPGIYLVRVNTPLATQTLKIIKSRNQ